MHGVRSTKKLSKIVKIYNFLEKFCFIDLQLCKNINSFNKINIIQ